MKRLLLLLLGCLGAAGCRTTDPNVPMLEAELRWLEDQYYVLEGQYNQKCQALDSCRLAHMAARQQSGEPIPAGERQPDQGESSRRRRTGDEVDSDTETLPPRPPEVQGLPEDAFNFAPEPTPAGVTPSSFHHAMDVHVTHIVLNRQLTGGFDRDGRVGDDGVLVVIEPRNHAGQFVPMTGGVTVALIDPRGESDDERVVAHWRLSAPQAASKMRRSLLGRGVHLELAWPVEPPRRSELKLEIIYTSVDGRKLRAERDITIDLPRALSARWTPITPDSPRVASVVESDRESFSQPAGAALPISSAAKKTPEPVVPPPSWSPQR